jgi:SAM-dependent methyltransferase
MDVEAELKRLEAQAAHFWSKEVEVLQRRGFPRDAHVLEVGCGPGFVTERLLGFVDHGAVTAIDNDPEMVALAQRRLVGVDRVDVLEASVTKTGFADATFDAVIARLLFSHLPDPEAALVELRRVLRPGGRLFVIDVDDGWVLLLDPEPPHLYEIVAALGHQTAERGGNRTIGRRLPRLLAKAGFDGLALDVVALHTLIDGAETTDVIGAMETLEQLANAGLISKSVFVDVRDYTERFECGELEVDGLLALLVVSGHA